jgi:hypothetical protein
LVEKTRGRGRRRWSKSSGEGGLERLVYFWQRARRVGRRSVSRGWEREKEMALGRGKCGSGMVDVSS